MIEKRQKLRGPVLVLLLIAITLVLCAGCSEKRLPQEIFVYKTDSTGTILWTANMTSGNQVYIDRIVESAETGNLIVGNNRGIVAEISPAGDVNRATSAENASRLSSITTDDGGQLTIGDSVVKRDANGSVQWEKNISYSNMAFQLKNGHYLVGHMNLQNIRIMNLVCLAPDGSVLWQNDVDVDPGSKISTMYESPDGMIEITSPYTVWGSNSDLKHLVETRQMTFDKDGHFISAKNLTAAGPILRTSEGYYLFVAYPWTEKTGFTTYYSNNGILHIVRLTGEGAILWNKPLTPSGKDSYPLSVIQTRDGGFAVLLSVAR
jgi:hypothetical protein